MQNPFHEGEREVQRLAGQESVAERNGTVIDDRIVGGALPFLAQQSMTVFGSSDTHGRLWASLVFGAPGFMKSADGSSVDFDLTRVFVERDDPFWANVEANSTVGMLAIELGSRRRIRINGALSRPAENMLRLSVREAFPNCPKYINRRKVVAVAPQDPLKDDPKESEMESGVALGAAQQHLLRHADVLFIASAHPTRGADASHRGGNPGFIEVVDDKTLRIPDYAGNGMFQTFGNLLVDTSAGIVVPDFEKQSVLQLTGRAEVQFNAPDPGNASGGTHRFLVFRITEWRQAVLPAGVNAELIDHSPFNPPVINPSQASSEGSAQ